MYEGEFMGIVDAKDADLHDLGEMMAGVRRKQGGSGGAVTTILLEKIDTLATFDEQRRVIKNGWVLIRDDAIEAMGGAGSEPGGRPAHHLSGHVVLPGLVNTHHHMFQSLLRNVPRLAGCVALQVAGRHVPADERGDRRRPVRGFVDQPRRAAALRLHDHG